MTGEEGRNVVGPEELKRRLQEQARAIVAEASKEREAIRQKIQEEIRSLDTLVDERTSVQGQIIEHDSQVAQGATPATNREELVQKDEELGEELKTIAKRIDDLEEESEKIKDRALVRIRQLKPPPSSDS